MTPKERAAVSIQNESETVSSLSTMRMAMQQAVDALEDELEAETCEEFHYAAEKCHDALTALREALAEQAEQEPVGVVEGSGEWGIAGVLVAGVPIGTKLYAAPVRTKDLTDDEIFKTNKTELPDCQDLVDFARAVIAADSEKNK